MAETCRDIYDNKSQLLHQVGISRHFHIWCTVTHTSSHLRVCQSRSAPPLKWYSRKKIFKGCNDTMNAPEAPLYAHVS